MILATPLLPPWKVATPIGDGEAHILYDPGLDHPARFLCSIDATGEYWCFTQVEIRRNTNITEGRTRLTPFSPEINNRLSLMRAIADDIASRGTKR